MKLRKRVLTLVALLIIGLIGCSKEESIKSSQSEDTNLELADINNNETEKYYTSYESYDNSEDEQSINEQSSLSRENDKNTVVSSNNDSSNNDTNTPPSSSNSSRYDKDYNEHIGEYVYVSSGNSYYHNISNCKYLEGASTSYVKLTSDMRKFECNCWENPVEYNPPTSSRNEISSNETSSSSGKTVYIAKGNSYYHNSPNCKFLNGANAYGVDLNDICSKHACNCVKY